MDIAKSSIVKSVAGRDEGELFFVIDVEDDFLLLADGKKHRIENPKRKKKKHAKFVCGDTSTVAEKIMRDEKITNSELRRAIAAKCGGNQDQEVF